MGLVMVDFERRLTRIQKYRSKLLTLEDPKPRYGVMKAYIRLLASCAIRVPRPTGVSLLQEHGLDSLIDELFGLSSALNTPGPLTAEFVSVANLVQLGFGPNAALSVLSDLRLDSEAPMFDAMRQGRICQLTGCENWTAEEVFPKKKLVPYFLPYLKLLEAVISGEETAPFTEAVDAAFQARQQVSIADDDLLGDKDAPLVWDHYKAAILEA